MNGLDLGLVEEIIVRTADEEYTFRGKGIERFIHMIGGATSPSALPPNLPPVNTETLVPNPRTRFEKNLAGGKTPMQVTPVSKNSNQYAVPNLSYAPSNRGKLEDVAEQMRKQAAATTNITY